jgi:hypothetical protein
MLSCTQLRTNVRCLAPSAGGAGGEGCCGCCRAEGDEAGARVPSGVTTSAEGPSSRAGR